MIISHRYRFIFIKTGKTAGTSIETALSPMCGPDDVVTPLSHPEPGHEPRNFRGWFNPARELSTRARARWVPMRGPAARSMFGDFPRLRPFYEHIPAWKVRDRIRPDVWDSYVTFAVERAPSDKVLSGWAWYQHRVGREVSLDSYLDLLERLIADSSAHAGFGMWPYNFRNYTDPVTREVIVDRLVWFDRLDDDLARLLQPLGVPFTPPLLPRAKAGVRRFGSGVMVRRHEERIRELFAEELALRS